MFVLFVFLNYGESNNEVTEGRHKRSIGPAYEDNCANSDYSEVKSFDIKLNGNIDDQGNLPRVKRQAALDPVEYSRQDSSIVRRKRLTEHLHHVRAQFEQCRQSQMDHRACEKFYREMINVREALSHEIETFGKIAKNFQSPTRPEHGMAVSNHKVMQGSARRPLSEVNREDQMLQKVNEFTPFPRFHEEMDNPRLNWNAEEPSDKQQELPMPRPPAPSRRVQSPAPATEFRDNDKTIPLKTQSFGKPC